MPTICCTSFSAKNFWRGLVTWAIISAKSLPGSQHPSVSIAPHCSANEAVAGPQRRGLTPDFMFRRVVASRIIPYHDCCCDGLLLVPGLATMFVNPTAATRVSLLARQIPLTLHQFTLDFAIQSLTLTTRPIRTRNLPRNATRSRSSSHQRQCIFLQLSKRLGYSPFTLTRDVYGDHVRVTDGGASNSPPEPPARPRGQPSRRPGPSPGSCRARRSLSEQLPIICW